MCAHSKPLAYPLVSPSENLGENPTGLLFTCQAVEMYNGFTASSTEQRPHVQTLLLKPFLDRALVVGEHSVHFTIGW